MLLSLIRTDFSFWLTVIVCGIVVLLLFVKVVKFWLKAILILGLIFLIGKCYLSKKTTSGRRTAVVIRSV